ncbi:MAG: ATP-binding protein [Bacteroidetes bacterium]|nr:ATP-binding protein [Bacteroidota bacterium]
MIRKVVVIGPESTGKSTLCEQLAQYYETRWCPEYARSWLLQNGTQYSFEDLLTIAEGQLQLEDEYTHKLENESLPLLESGGNIPLIIDTDMYVMKVWCEFVFGKCHRFVLDHILKRKYDLYLLCDTDLPWTKDELREYPDLKTRQALFRMYKDLLINQSTPWSLVTGNGEERLQSALREVNKMLSQSALIS